MKIFWSIKKFVNKYILRKKYVRSGACNRCGACCSRIYVRHGQHTINSEKEFSVLRHLHPFYSYLKVEGKDDLGLIFSCSNFDSENHICKIHKRRPGICRRYPDEIIFSMGACLSEGCGYAFKPIDKFSDVLKSIEKRPVKNCTIFLDDVEQERILEVYMDQKLRNRLGSHSFPKTHQMLVSLLQQLV